MFPAVCIPLLQAASSNGITAVRNPFEPKWSLDATIGAPALRRLQVRILNRLHGKFRKNVVNAGMNTTDGAVGVLAVTLTATHRLWASPAGSIAWLVLVGASVYVGFAVVWAARRY